MPTVPFDTAQHFEWDTPWSFGFLAVCCLLAAAWSVWQLRREAAIAQSRGSLLFIVLRTIVAGVLLWMILGPTTVLVSTETHPQSLAVYVDTSSSMQLRDQADPVVDRRWELSAAEETDPLISADSLVLMSESLQQRVARLIGLVDQQASTAEKQENVDGWNRLAAKTAALIEGLSGKPSLTTPLRAELRQLAAMLKDELQPLASVADWLTGKDAGDREERLRFWEELGRQFSTRCRTFAENLAQAFAGEWGRATATDHLAQSRLEKVVPTLQRGLAAWRRPGRQNFRILAAEFAETVAPLSVDEPQALADRLGKFSDDSAMNRNTDLVEALRQIRDESAKEQLSAAVLMTDGRHTVVTDEDPRQLAGQLRVPLYIVPVGWGEMRRDVILHHMHAPATVMEKDTILIEGMVTAYRCAGERCEIQLLEGNEVLDSKTVDFQHEQQDQPVRFDVETKEVGRREFTVRVSEVRDEFSQDNNSSVVGVNVVDAVLRVLIADNSARWEHQYLVNLVRRQQQMEFDQLKFVPQQIGTGAREASGEFPQTVSEWSDYRVVILGDISPRQLPRKSQEALREYIVQRGGCLIVIAGQNSMPHAFAGEPLADLLPVEDARGFEPVETGYRVEMTAEGKTQDVMRLDDDVTSTEAIWRQVNSSLPIHFLSSYHRPKPTSEVLLSARPLETLRASEQLSFLCWHRVGAGRVACLSSPSTYHLRLRSGDKYHYRFWGQLVRWIASNSLASGSKSVRLQADKSHYTPGDVAQFRLELSDETGRPVTGAQPAIEAQRGGEGAVSVALSPDPKVPGRYLGSFAAEDAGRYAVRAKGPEVERLLAAEKRDGVEIQIEFQPEIEREQLDPRADRPLLEYLAEQTGGLVLEPTALAALPEILELEPRKIESARRTPLWNRWWCLWVIAGCLTLEWVARKQFGLA